MFYIVKPFEVVQDVMYCVSVLMKVTKCQLFYNCKALNHVQQKKLVGCLAYKLNSLAVVLKRTIPIERPPLVGEVNANFLRIEGVAWSVQQIPRSLISVF
jgi:hypothetical protein